MLKATPEAACEWLPEPSADDEAEVCGALSRFVVERDDGARGYGPAESCAEHLGEVVPWLIDGSDEFRAIVTIRWDWYDETHPSKDDVR